MKHFISAIFFPLLLCWVSVASGKTAITWQSQGFFGFSEHPIADPVSDYHLLLPENGNQKYKRRYTTHQLSALLRFQQGSSLIQARHNTPQPDSLSQALHIPYIPSIKPTLFRTPPLATILNRVRLFPPQQNRLGGWKESNIQYRGKLTYHTCYA
ncbi:hypothetical protein [Enterobacillus tribolii]|uniref:hypothetical protein n=1 Tax=Enterobacillus tribolii TaxID=1487935 RepID=UPI000E1CD966|nr:hypothetical protein [Enterobacillus tribolii]MBW7982728.1 hypothetical protein [Enterobacillus tribolii]